MYIFPSTYYLEYVCHVLRLHRRRRVRCRVYAPTRNTAGQSIHGFPLFPYMGIGLRLGALRAAGAPLLTNVKGLRQINYFSIIFRGEYQKLQNHGQKEETTDVIACLRTCLHTCLHTCMQPLF